MARYTVHVPGRPDARAEALERAVFARDGWGWGAFSFGPLWLIWNRHWIVGLLALVVYGAVLIALVTLPAQDIAKSAAMLLLALLWGFEGSSLRRVALNWSGYVEAGLVVGDDLDTLERRFFAEMAQDTIASPLAATPADPLHASGGAVPRRASIIGLFPDPRKPT